jgi:hypothetical protein
MSDKAFGKLNEIDQAIRRELPTGMNNGVHLTIEFFSGFEIFNTRRYHNYETWSDGYRVKDDQGYEAQGEDLDQAIAAWVKQRHCEHDGKMWTVPTTHRVCMKCLHREPVLVTDPTPEIEDVLAEWCNMEMWTDIPTLLAQIAKEGWECTMWIKRSGTEALIWIDGEAPTPIGNGCDPDPETALKLACYAARMAALEGKNG